MLSAGRRRDSDPNCQQDRGSEVHIPAQCPPIHASYLGSVDACIEQLVLASEGAVEGAPALKGMLIVHS